MGLFFADTICNESTNNNGLISNSSLPHACANSTNLNTIFLVAFAVIGSVAFLFIVIGGARYALSKGEPDNIQRAKNEIKYSAIGLVIVALAAAIVNFVLDKLKQP